jgi:hypothetical protein
MEKKGDAPEGIMRNGESRLNDTELESVSGGGLFISVDPGKCPKGQSKYVIYADRRFANDACTGCEHVKEFGQYVRCEYSYTGNYEWEW